VRKTSIFTFIVFAALLVLTLPAYADSFVTFSQPSAPYTTMTTNYGGGDGSGGYITSLGPFSFSVTMYERAVTASWETWNAPPAVESSTPNVLYTNGPSSVTLTLNGSPSIVGFELEPDFGNDAVSAAFYNGATLIDSVNLDVNWSSGALLFALADTTPGASISSVAITDDTSDDFAIAQLRAGSGTVTPEPGTLSLLGLGMLGLAKLAYRNVKA